MRANPKIEITRRRAWSAAAFVCLLACASAYAADKGGVSPNVVELPDGPGSIQGLGETFEPDLSTGTAKYGLTLALPPGTAGHTPDLALSYDGGNGNGPLGYGWALDVPFVQRKTSEGIPRYIDTDNGIDDDGDGEIDEFSERDRFITHLAENLIPRDDGFFFSEREESFLRFQRETENDDDFWIATRPNGTVLEIGPSPGSICGHPDIDEIFAWHVERETDVHGNTIFYTYISFPDDKNTNQLYLSKVEYGAGAPPWDNFHFVVFDYEDRPDWFEDGRAGFITRTGKRLKSITVGTQGPELEGHAAGDFNHDAIADYLNRRYELSYDAHEHWSLLTSVTQIGFDGVTALPPLTMEYTVCESPEELSLSDAEIVSANTPLHLLDNDLAQLTDLNADGLPDILKTGAFGDPHIAYLNEGVTVDGDVRTLNWRGGFTIGGDPRANAINFGDLGSATALLADITSDGRSDLVYKVDNAVYVFANVVNGESIEWGTRTQMFTPLGGTLPAWPFKTPDAQRANVNSDKRSDIIQSISTAGLVSYRYWINFGGRLWSKAFTVSQDFGFMFSNNDIDLVDMNGDDVFDIVRITPSSLIITAGLGYGKFAPPITVDLPDITLTPLQISKVSFNDITGNGLPDLVIERPAPGKLWYWLNLGNYTLDERRVIGDVPQSFSEVVTVRWADLNGNGTTDLIYSDRLTLPRLQVFDIGQLLGCAPSPNLLKSIDNGIGRTMRIQYASSTEHMLLDRREGRDWAEPFPLNIDVVDEVNTDDSLGNTYTVEYRYHDPHISVARFPVPPLWFMGFAEAEEIHIGDATAPTMVARSNFDTGSEYLQLRGKLLRQSIEQEDGSVHSIEETEWRPRLLFTGLDGRDVIFPEKVSQTRDVIELGQGDPRRIELEFAFDDYGNQTEERLYGLVESGDRSAGNDERITITEYALNSESWIIHKPTRIETQNLAGDVISRQELFYDDPAFAGDNLGEVVLGDLTLERTWIDPVMEESFVASSRTVYDEFGNAVTLLDPLAEAPDGVLNVAAGHHRDITYDDAFQVYPVQESIQVGAGSDPLVLNIEYDEGIASVIAATDFNGFETTYGHDPFGRLVNKIRPGDSEAFPTVEYVYVFAQPTENGGLVNYLETRLLDREPPTKGVVDPLDYYFIMRSFTDGMGRVLMEKMEAETNPETSLPRVAVNQAVQFNARRGVHKALQPFFSLLPAASLDELLNFEDIDDPAWQGEFHLNGELVSASLSTAPVEQIDYDVTLREIRTTHADGTFRESRFEPLRSLIYDENDLDPNSPFFGTPIAHVMDGLGRLASVEELVRLEDDGTMASELQVWTTHFQHRADGLLTRIIDSQGNETIFEYDGLGGKTFVNDPNRGTFRFAYDDAGNLIESLDSKEQLTTYTHDGVNRMLTKDYHDEGESFSFNRVFDPMLPVSGSNMPDIAFFYDTPLGDVDLGNGDRATASNTLGKLAYAVDLSGEEHYSYDGRGRKTRIIKRITDPVDGRLVSYTTKMTFDSQDRLLRMTYPDGDECTYAYNRGNLVESISGGATANQNAVPFILASSTFAPSGRRTAIELGNGVTTSFNYDNRARLVALESHRADAPMEPLTKYAYTFDNASNITSITDLRPESVRPAGDPLRNSQLFAYDDLYRLASVQYSAHLPEQELRDDGKIEYRYDRIGNMLSKTSAMVLDVRGLSVTHLGDMTYGGEAGALNRVGRDPLDPPGPHALTAADDPNDTEDAREFAYDANGNMTNLDDLVSTWDFNDRLVALEDESMRAEYIYNLSGLRTIKKVWKKSANGDIPILPTNTTIYAGRHFEIREGGQPVKFVFNGETRVARITGTLEPTADRVQRFELTQGWNVFTMAIDAADAAEQLGLDVDPLLDAALIWDDVSGTYIEADAATLLPPGTVLWLSANAPGTLHATGSYTDPTIDSVAIQDNLIAFASLEAFPVNALLSAGAESAWAFSHPRQTWQARLAGDHAFLSDLPPFIQPGQPVFADISSIGALEFPAPSQRIHYYLKDHLGSSSVVVDAQGDIVEETTFLPFGERRAHEKSSAAENTVATPYLFSQKERDEESGLYYFEARYLAASLGRFTRVDPIAGAPPSTVLADPQQLNTYAYARNNPVILRDPDGRLITDKPFDKADPAKGFRRFLGATEDDDPVGVFDKSPVAGVFDKSPVAGVFDNVGTKKRNEKFKAKVAAIQAIIDDVLKDENAARVGPAPSGDDAALKAATGATAGGILSDTAALAKKLDAKFKAAGIKIDVGDFLDVVDQVEIGPKTKDQAAVFKGVEDQLKFIKADAQAQIDQKIKKQKFLDDLKKELKAKLAAAAKRKAQDNQDNNNNTSNDATQPK